MIVYEGEELVLHQAEGETDYLLVTFSGAWETADATRTFFAEEPARKNRISCLGVTTKVDYYYISPETDHVLSLIRDIAAGYSRVILFGVSMGGYAALAFSRALGADIVFAGAPKWSVDPGECEIDADTVRRNFRDGMQGMGIRPDQVQGQIYVACDPADREDAYNLTKITEHIPDIHYIPVFHAEHVVMKSLNGSAVFGALIRTLLTGDPELLRRFISDVRRKNPTNIRNRLAVGHARHPLLCYRMVNAFYARAGDTFRDLLAGEALISLLIYRLIRAGYNREARDLFVSATSLRLTGRRATAPRHSGPDALVMSSHAFVVSYDIAGARLHGRKFIIPDNTSVPVLCHETAGEKYATVLISAQRFYIRQEGDRFLLTPDRHDKGVLRFLQVPADHPRENGQQSQVVALRTPNGYACFHPDYSNHLDSPNLLDWELLALCPLGHPDPVRTAGVTNDNVRTVIEDYKELPAAKTKRS